MNKQNAFISPTIHENLLEKIEKDYDHNMYIQKDKGNIYFKEFLEIVRL